MPRPGAIYDERACIVAWLRETSIDVLSPFWPRNEVIPHDAMPTLREAADAIERGDHYQWLASQQARETGKKDPPDRG